MIRLKKNSLYLHIKIHNCVFVPLQLLSHTSAALPASVLWPSTARLWETRSTWARGVDWQRGWGTRSGTAWCSAAAKWRSRRGFVWGWRMIHLTGTELCAWASPTCRPRPDLCLCPTWPSPTSLRSPGTGLPLCMNPTAKQVQSWSSGFLMEATYTLQATTTGSTSYWQEWISASHCGSW